MDFNDEVVRLLQNMDQHQRDFNKHTLDSFKTIAKDISKLSDSERQRKVSEARLRYKARGTTEKTKNEINRDKAEKNLNDSLKNVTKGFDSFLGVLTLSTDSLIDFVSSLKTLPVVGMMVTTALGGLVVNGIQTTIDSFRHLNKQGVVVGNGIFDLNIAAVEAGMGIKEFSELLGQNALLVHRYGIDAISDLNASLRDTDGYLRTMGLTTRDITGFLFDYLQIRRRTGVEEILNREIERQRAEQFAKMMERISIATGTGFDELRKAMLKEAEDPSFALALQNVPEDIRNEMLAITAALGSEVPSLSGIFQSLITGAGVGYKDLNLIEQFFPGFAEALRDIEEGSGSASEALNILKQEAENLTEAERDQIVIMEESGTELGKLTAGLAKAGVNYEEVSDEVIAHQRKITEGTARINDMIQKFRESLLTPLFAALGEMDEVELQHLEERLVSLSTSLGNIISGAFSAENITRLEGAVNAVSSAIDGIATFFEEAFGINGLVGVALTAAFGLKLPGLLATAVSSMFIGNRMPGPSRINAAVGPGFVGTLVGSKLMRGIGWTGVATNIIGMIQDGINNEIDSGTIGTGAGTLVGGIVGTLFGPGGVALGSAIGGFIGGAVGDIVASMSQEDSEMITALKGELETAVTKRTNASTIEELQAADQEISNINTQIEETRAQEKIDDLAKAKLLQLWSGPGRSMLFNGSILSPTDQQALYDLIDMRMTPDMTLDQAKQIQNYFRKISQSGSQVATDFLKILEDNNMLFAKGGVTTKPAIFGEAGAEAAIPLDNGMRIPIAEMNIAGLDAINDMVTETNKNSATMNDSISGLKRVIENFISWMMTNNANKEQIELLVGIHEKLNDIAGTNSSINRNMRPVSI